MAPAWLLGEDAFGRRLGVARGAPWRGADQSHSGVFETSLVKVVPDSAFCTACFNPGDPVVDVDIVLPVRWVGDVLEEIDLELDILRTKDRAVRVRGRETFDSVCAEWAMPGDIAARAEATCERVCARVELGAEPFGDVGRAWLSRFVADAGRKRL